MARIKRTCDDHLLVGYRVRSGEPERYWRCPDKAAFERFDELDRLCKRQGTDTPDPAVQFSEVPKAATARATKKAEARQARRAAREEAAKRGTYTAAEWVGQPKEGEPGPFFTYHTKTMSARRKSEYRRVLDQFGAAFKSKPMNTVTKADATLMVGEMLVCPNCLERAEQLGRIDLIADKHRKLLASERPFDNGCLDDDGDSIHWGTYQRATVNDVLSHMGALWGAAMGVDHTEDVRADKVVRNPFKSVPVPQYADRPDNNDVVRALSHTQLESWAKAHPEELEAIAWVGTHALLRRGELMGVSRVNIVWPTLPEHGGRAILNITHVYAVDDGQWALRPWGKNPGATWTVPLTALATEKLREHMTKFRSKRNPTACHACRAGTGEHADASPNPHRGCDFADNAPVWIHPANGERLKPSTYTKTIAPAAAVAAGLTPERIGFKVTPKVQRLTGATQLIEAGVPIEEVTRLGRWTTSTTPLKHYHRMRDERVGDLLSRFDDDARAQLGIDLREDAHTSQRIVFAERNRVRAEEENALLREALAAAGVDPDQVVTQAAPQRIVVTTTRTNAFADEAAVREAIETSTSRAEILKKLGIAAATKNYARLVDFADEHDLALPGKWGRKTA